MNKIEKFIIKRPYVVVIAIVIALWLINYISDGELNQLR